MTRGLRLAAAVSFALAVAGSAAAATKAGTAASAAAPAASAAPPSEFVGELEPGKRYVGDFSYDANALRIWRPVRDVQVAKDSAWTIDWVNLAQFPALASASVRARPQRLRFKVLELDVSSGSPEVPWTVVCRCQIEAVEKPAAVAPPPGKRR